MVKLEAPELRAMLEELERVAGQFVAVDDDGRIVDADDREVDDPLSSQSPTTD